MCWFVSIWQIGVCSGGIRSIPCWPFGLPAKSQRDGRLFDCRLTHRSGGEQLQRIELSNYEYSWTCFKCAGLQSKQLKLLSISILITIGIHIAERLIAYPLFSHMQCPVREWSCDWSTIFSDQRVNATFQSGCCVPWTNTNITWKRSTWCVCCTKNNG